jgi:anaerobic magnesium-protoporphyrin IX monomethyl ester cyclase
MRVLLVAPPCADTFGYSMPPPGLLRLGGELRRRGVEVGLEDLSLRLAAGELPEGDELARAAADVLLARGPSSCVGFSVMGATLPIALCIAAELRERAPALRIALGGPGALGIEEALLARFACVDAVVRGEGEATLLELVAAWERDAPPAGVLGLSWRAADGSVRREPERAPLRSLAELADYAWDMLPPIARYQEIRGASEGLVALDSGRGCSYDCSFCTIGRFWSRRSRALPAERLADEVEALAHVPGARRAYLCHDIFGADRKHALAFCAELERRGRPLPWEARARADHLDDELVERMGAAGCVRVLLGIESADGALRNRHGKSMRAELDVLRLVERLDRAGIAPILSLILGLPGEGERELAATIELAASAALRAGVHLSFHLVNPQPGCALGELEGARSRPLADIAPDMALGAGQSAGERALIAAHPDLFSCFALLSAGEHAAQLPRLALLRDLGAPLLMRHSRSFGWLARRRGLAALALLRELVQSERSYESHVRAARDPVASELLAWEHAQLRCAAAEHGALELLRPEHDLAAIAAWLRGAAPAEPPPPALCAPQPAALAVVRGARGQRSLRLALPLAELLEELRAGADAQALAARHPRARAALAALERAGLAPAARGLSSERDIHAGAGTSA